MRPQRFSLDDLISALPKWKDASMVEVGSYQGESTEAFAKSGKFGTIYAVDPWINEIYDPNDKATLHCDMAIVEAAFDERMAPYGGMITKLKCHSYDAIRFIEPTKRRFQFIYLDGDHRYDSVKIDILRWRIRVVNGGILAGHDYGTHPGVKRAVDEIFGKPDETFKDYSWLVHL
jgi:hypothetical protein